MNGPEHYAEAERLVGEANGADVEFAAYLTGKAQVHATLALAAATVHDINPHPGDRTGKRWVEVTS